ncbi:tektin-1 isoform X2 [Corythoichthys intestinalis]|uniref:tektin-1 isoform X2 n=1 Tax=Corythoichthys intestinalis TaxID=161448 RepID=UPI0025A4F9C9|nr:tektin-1 isoform X2 [Corythoichthys intestinalis]XP_061796940.1 tektin-1 [Nerophis lumbriciformis]
MSTRGKNTYLLDGSTLESINVIRNHSKLFRGECARLIEDCSKSCKRLEDDDSERLDHRVRDIQFVKQELEQKLEENILETDHLIELQNRVTKAIESCKEPLRVTLLCIEERNKPPEKVHDQVSRELLKEGDLTKGVMALMQRVIKQITEQIRLNQTAKFQLEQDLKGKYVAQDLDTSCAAMTPHSLINPEQKLKASNATSGCFVTPVQWGNHSDFNIGKAEQQKKNTISLRALVESLLAQTAADMQKQFEATTAAFQFNIKQLKTVKNQMEDQLTKVVSEFASQQKNREDLIVAVTENNRFLSLAQKRLSVRQQRPTKEKCHDPAQSQLLAEVGQLSFQITKLHETVDQSEEQQRALVRCQLELRHNIEVKDRLLYVDEVICGQLRKPIVIHNF